MRRADAPPPGWYPDPTGGVGLWWWDGLDWTHHRRPPPAASGFDGEGALGAHDDEAHSSAADVATATQLRSRAEITRSEARREARRAQDDAAAVVAEARRAARDEVEKAVTELRGQFSSTTEQWRPRLEAYARRLRRWARIAVVVVIVLVAISAWLNATASVGLLEWLGERIDSATSMVLPLPGLVALRSLRRRWPLVPGDRPTHERPAPVGRGARLR